MTRTFPSLIAIVLCVGACATSADVKITEVPLDAMPASVVSAISAERPGFEASEVLRKDRDGRTYYDVEGLTAEGAELEFDILMHGDQAEIVEIQRDLAWSEVPDEVKEIVPGVGAGIVPARIIESVQTDGSVIYELFAEGAPSDPAHEVRVHGGTVELLDERWIH
ncbi:MAG: hypothetical protein RH945_03100 [Hyphomonas sp.]